MSFSGTSFLILFLPLAILLYFLSKNIKYKNGVLIVLSLIFYSWGETQYFILLILSSLFAYAIALGFAHFKGKPIQKKVLFLFSLGILCFGLFFFKYSFFFTSLINKLFSLRLSGDNISLPLGISFYLFQVLSYIIDVYKEKIQPEKNIFYLLLYVSFFPKLLMGPIVRYEDMREQISSRTSTIEKSTQGAKRFILGLAKKVILSSAAANIASIIYAQGAGTLGSLAYWVGALAYAVQLYFDFSGYTDMALGLGEIFGFSLCENFNKPYCATSVSDFWRRWHTTLSSWFRDYVYIPLGGNRVPKGRWILNILTVWLLTGLWHGSTVNFLIWGLYYGILLIIEKLFFLKYTQKLPHFLRVGFTFSLVLVGWTIFNITDISSLILVLRSMFSFRATDWNSLLLLDTSFLSSLPILLLGTVLSLMPKKENKRPLTPTLSNALFLVLFILSVSCVVSSSFQAFIYFKF